MKIAYPQVANKQNAKADVMRTAHWETVEYPECVKKFKMVWDGDVESSAQKNAAEARECSKVEMRKLNALSFYCVSRSRADGSSVSQQNTGGTGTKDDPFTDMQYAVVQIFCILKKACFMVNAVLHVSGVWDYSVGIRAPGPGVSESTHGRLFIDGKQEDDSILKPTFKSFTLADCHFMNFEFTPIGGTVSLGESVDTAGFIVDQQSFYNCTFDRLSENGMIGFSDITADFMYKCKVMSVFVVLINTVIDCEFVSKHSIDISQKRPWSPDTPCLISNSKFSSGDLSIDNNLCEIGVGAVIDCETGGIIKQTRAAEDNYGVSRLVVASCGTAKGVVSSAVVLDSQFYGFGNVYAVNCTTASISKLRESQSFVYAKDCKIDAGKDIITKLGAERCTFNILECEPIEYHLGDAGCFTLESNSYTGERKLIDNRIYCRCTKSYPYDLVVFAIDSLEYITYNMSNNTIVVDMNECSRAEIYPLVFDRQTIDEIKAPQCVVFDMTINIPKITYNDDNEQWIVIYGTPIEFTNSKVTCNIGPEDPPPSGGYYRHRFNFSHSFINFTNRCGTVGEGETKRVYGNGTIYHTEYTWTGDTYIEKRDGETYTENLCVQGE